MMANELRDHYLFQAIAAPTRATATTRNRATFLAYEELFCDMSETIAAYERAASRRKVSNEHGG